MMSANYGYQITFHSGKTGAGTYLLGWKTNQLELKLSNVIIQI